MLCSSGCTGVLLTASYVLTAAHCTKLIDEKYEAMRELSLQKKCVETGLQNYRNKGGGQNIKKVLNIFTKLWSLGHGSMVIAHKIYFWMNKTIFYFILTVSLIKKKNPVVRSLKCKFIITRADDGEVLQNLEIVASPPGTVIVGVNNVNEGKYSDNYP